MQTAPLISFIIPVFNEKDYICKTLTLLHKYSPQAPYEVIIVDNGSSDNTIELAKNFGDCVLSCPVGTIAEVRNFGVKHSTGQVLVFIDADVELSQEWQNNIADTIELLSANPYTITGSRCLPPQGDNILNEHWFKVLALYDSYNYINSGHLITSRELFDAISGFNIKLKTAEDHDFCIRAKNAGAEINANTALIVVHDGYPKKISDFIKRERWHGREDFETISSTLSSKIAFVVMLHLFVICITVISMYNASILNGLSIYLISMLFISLGITLLKFKGRKLNSLLKTSLVHYYYIIGRTLSLIDKITSKHAKKFR